MLEYEYGISRSEESLVIDEEGIVEFSPAGEGTRVSLHALHTLLGLIV